MKLNIFKRIEEFGSKIATLQADTVKTKAKLEAAYNSIRELNEKIAVLERINLYGRGDEPNVIVDTVSERYDDVERYDLCVCWDEERILRLYIDGEEYTIRNVDGLGHGRYMTLNKSIMVNGDIATVVIQTDPEVEDIYHIEYDKGTYVHQIRKIEKESEE